MVHTRLVTFDARGAEIDERELTDNEIVTALYDVDGETVPVFDVEVKPNGFSAGGPEVRVNLNEGLALLFANPDEAREFLGHVEDRINEAVARYVPPRQEPEMVEVDFPIRGEVSHG